MALACTAESRSPPDLERTEGAAVEVVRVGSSDDPDYAFTWFRELRVGRGGHVYTLHPLDRQVRVHDEAGRFVRTIGREGEGPGEFTNPGRMGFIADTLWVLDFGTYRFSYFEPGGDLIRTSLIPIELGATMEERPARQRELASDGSILASPPAWSRAVAAGDITQQVVLTMAPDGDAGDTLFTYSLENTVLEVDFSDDPRDRHSYGRQPFADGDLVSAVPGEAAFVRVRRRVSEAGPDPVVVTKTTFSGERLYRVELPVDTIEIGSEDIEARVTPYAQQLAERSFRDRSQEQIESVIRDRLYNPRYWPPVSELALGHDGSVWLRGPVVRERGEVDWTVLRATGDIVGRVVLPEGYSVLDAEVGQVWGSEFDDLGVPYIVSYRVEWSNPASSDR